MSKICASCGNSFSRTGGNQKYCGSIAEKTGCSYEMDKLHKKYTLDGKQRVNGWAKKKIDILDAFGICVFCGAQEDLTVDHIIPKMVGGSDELNNLRVLCRSCNSKRHQRLIKKAMEYYFRVSPQE